MSDSTAPLPVHLPVNRGPGFLTRTYYRLKPFIPVRLRWAVRRCHARSRMAGCRDVWPIDQSASARPAGWKGWPDGKKFALVVTHDVESEVGVRLVRPLAKLVKSHGLRSSFNFIPEGTYSDPVDIRRWLQHMGFEVGVHDLKHDGRLYDSRESFRRSAGQINRYLSSWNAVGFRSGFMLCRPDWLHDLEVCYDASTFDTDPFEPQPEGSGTIFPFMVKQASDHSGSGYVELPYTLPQDSTLFLLLGETSIDIWKRKLDWIVENGGLALVNIHPDYMSFDVSHRFGESYSSELISEFFDYIHSKYGNEFWNPLPCEISRWYRENLESTRLGFQSRAD